ncbi:MAG: 50S ribosomal protein L24 [Clostridia bacterium]|nr:50S ribosomal protein L24 [Clostridia bacterium]
MKLKKGDNVQVLAGNDKGKTSEIIEVFPKENKVIVKDVNIKKKATKPRKAGETGGIISKEFPVNASNVAVVCPNCKKAVKVGYKVEGDKKVRICRSCKTELK